MTSRDFCYWLQGFFELTGDQRPNNEIPNLTPGQVNNIMKHLAMVFKHEIDPSMGNEQHQHELNVIHGNTRPEPLFPSKNDTLYRC